MAIVFDAAIGNQGTTSTTNASLNHAANVQVLVFVSYVTTTSPTVTVGGVSAPAISGSKASYGTSLSCEWFSVYRSGAANESVVIDFAGVNRRHCWNAVSYTGVSQDSWETLNGGSATGASPLTSGVTIDAGTTGRMALGGVVFMDTTNGTGTVTAAAANGETERDERNLSGGSASKSQTAASYEFSSSASHNFQVTGTKSGRTLLWISSVLAILPLVTTSASVSPSISPSASEAPPGSASVSPSVSPSLSPSTSVSPSLSPSAIPPGVQGILHRTSDQSIASGTTYTAISFDMNDIDTDGMYSSGSPTRLTIQSPGYYLAIARMQFTGNGSGMRDLAISVNNVVEASQMYVPHTWTGNWGLTCPWMGTLSAGDYLEMVVRQDSGSSLNCLAVAKASPYFTLVRIPAVSHAEVWRSTDDRMGTLPANTWDPFSFDTEVVDTGGFYSAANPTRFTATVDGRYLFFTSCQWEADANGFRDVCCQRDGNVDWKMGQQTSCTTNVLWNQAHITVMQLTAGMYVESMRRQYSDGLLSALTVANLSPIFKVAHSGCRFLHPDSKRVLPRPLLHSWSGG